MNTTKQTGNIIAAITLGLFMLSIATAALAQKRETEPVKVKIVKIVDGDTSVIEKTLEESKVEDFTKQFQDIKGKNVQVTVNVEGEEKEKGRNKQASAMAFSMSMDSSVAKALGKCFIFSDSAHCKKFVWHDSLLKGMPMDFDFKFDFDHDEMGKDFDFNFDIDVDTDDDGKTVIVRSNKGNTIIINGDEDNITINESEKGKTKTKTKTVIVNDEKSKTKKKVIVTTSVMVIDMDDEKSGERKQKDEFNFGFYPNPSDGNFTLDLDLSSKEEALVRITDMNGKEVYSEKFSGSGKVSKNVSLEGGKKGTFIVTIKQGKKTTSKKIIIE